MIRISESFDENGGPGEDPGECRQHSTYNKWQRNYVLKFLVVSHDFLLVCLTISMTRQLKNDYTVKPM